MRKKEGLKMVQTMVAGGLGMLLYMIFDLSTRVSQPKK